MPALSAIPSPMADDLLRAADLATIFNQHPSALRQGLLNEIQRRNTDGFCISETMLRDKLENKCELTSTECTVLLAGSAKLPWQPAHVAVISKFFQLHRWEDWLQLPWFRQLTEQPEARQPEEDSMATATIQPTGTAEVSGIMARITTLANRHPKHFGDLVLNALGTVGATPATLAEKFNSKGLQPSELKFLMPWLQVHLGSSRPTWQDKHIEAMLVVFDTTPSKFLETLCTKTGEKIQVSTPELAPEENKTLLILVKHAGDKSALFTAMVFDRMVAKNITTCDGLATTFAQHGMRPDKGNDLFLRLKGEIPMVWESAHVQATLTFLGDTPESFLAYAREYQQAKTVAKTPPPAPATPPAAVKAPEVAATKPTEPLRPVAVVPSSALPVAAEGVTFDSLAKRADAKRVEFGKLISAILEERKILRMKLHEALDKANVVPSNSGNTYALLGGKGTWNELRVNAVAKFLKLSAAELDERFTTWLQGPVKTEATPVAEVSPAPKPAPVPAAVTAPEPEPAAAEVATDAADASAPADEVEPEPESEPVVEIDSAPVEAVSAASIEAEPVAMPDEESAAVTAPEPEPAPTPAVQTETAPAEAAPAISAEPRPEPEPQPEPAAVMAPPKAESSPAATAITVVTEDPEPVDFKAKLAAANEALNGALRPAEAGMLELAHENLQAMGEPARCELLQELMTELKVDPAVLSQALWQVAKYHLQHAEPGKLREKMIHGVLGKTLGA